MRSGNIDLSPKSRGADGSLSGAHAAGSISSVSIFGNLISLLSLAEPVLLVPPGAKMPTRVVLVRSFMSTRRFFLGKEEEVAAGEEEVPAADAPEGGGLDPELADGGSLREGNIASLFKSMCCSNDCSLLVLQIGLSNDEEPISNPEPKRSDHFIGLRDDFCRFPVFIFPFFIIML